MAIRKRSNPQSRAKQVPEPLIGSFLLESITTGMYGERKNAIREYVQNSFDGIQSAVDRRVLRRGGGKITITLDENKDGLVVHDNGAGLPKHTAVNTLVAVGASRKERGQQAGFRGIGRLAGIAFCKTLQFRTKAAGEEVETFVWFDCDALRRGMLNSGRTSAVKLITECTTYDQPKAVDVEDHYFEVSLLGLRNAPVEATDPLQLEIFLSQVAPVGYHPDFAKFTDQIIAGAEALEIPDIIVPDGNGEDDEPDWSVIEDAAASMLERIPVPAVRLGIRVGEKGSERSVYKPYRPKLGLDDSQTDVALTGVSLVAGASGAWWGWVGHKAKPGEYQNAAVGGLRFRLKNIQIDGSELITLVPTSNDVRSPFSRWSNWFVGEIHVDPRAVVPNARRDNFEEDARWLAIRDEISAECKKMTKEARDVSKAHQTSIETLDAKAVRLREGFLAISRAKTFSLPKARKLLSDSEKLQRDIEKASNGAPSAELVRLRTIAKEVTQIRVGLVDRPQTPEYENFRTALRDEFLKTTLDVLNDYLDIDDYEEIKTELERRLK